jgi:hypothetical protein
MELYLISYDFPKLGFIKAILKLFKKNYQKFKQISYSGRLDFSNIHGYQICFN